MENRLWKKGIVLGIILLFIGASVTPNILVENVRADPEDGLVAYWSFDDGTATDNSGNGNDGIIYGTSTATGISSNALSFDGVDDYVDFGDKFEFSDGTIEFWFKPAEDILGSLDQRQVIYSKSYAHTTASFFIAIGSDAVLTFSILGAYNPNQWHQVSSVTTNWYSTTWYHLVAVWGSSGMKLYVNSIIEDSNSYLGEGVHSSYSTVIGAWKEQLTNPEYTPFNGIIDEACIYNRALTQSEIQERYEEHQTSVGLGAYWSFDEGSGTTVYDSASDNDGTIYGATWTTGYFGNGLEFDGIDDYISLPVGQETGLELEHVNVDVWVYPYEIGERQVIFAYRPAYSGGDGRGYILQIREDGKVSFSIGDGSPPYSYAESTNSLEANNWYHIVGSFDGSNINVYINDVLEGTSIQTNPIIYSDGSAYDPPSKNCVIGSLIRWNGDYHHFFDGIIDELKIYSTTVEDEGENIPPTVYITYPADGKYVYENSHITGSASDSDGTIEYVEIKISNIEGLEDWYAVDGTAEWTKYTYFENFDPGTYTISARSYDGEEYSTTAFVEIVVPSKKEKFAVKYAPELAFHPQEKYHPMAVEGVLESSLLEDGHIIILYLLTKIRIHNILNQQRSNTKKFRVIHNMQILCIYES